MNRDELINNQKVRSLIFFILFAVLIIIFLLKMTYEAFGDRRLPSQSISISDKSIRGKIVTSDGFTVAQSSKLYKTYIYAPGIAPSKRDLFISLFSIYSGMEEADVRRRM